MLSDGTNSMTYDAENRRNPTSGTTFTYDGDGRRVAKSDGTLYWVDDSFRPLSLGTNTGSITKDFVFLGSKRIAFVALSSGNPYYYLSDHLGSTAVISSGDGKAIEWETDYFPFGNERQVFTNLVSNLYQFTGYEYDSSSGYNYAVARFEAGKWSRFLSPDPYMGSMSISNPQSLNRYAYVMNNPLRYVDPSGLACVVYEKDDGTEGFYDDGNPGESCADAFSDIGGGNVVEGGPAPQEPTVTDPGNNNNLDPCDLPGVCDGLGNPVGNPNGNGNVGTPGGGGSGAGSTSAGSNSNNQTLSGQPAGMIQNENNAFEQCVKQGEIRAVGVGTITTIWDRKGSPLLNIGEAALDLQAECLAEHPLAAASPNYKGLFLPGDSPVSPIIDVLGKNF